MSKFRVALSATDPECWSILEPSEQNNLIMQLNVHSSSPQTYINRSYPLTVPYGPNSVIICWTGNAKKFLEGRQEVRKKMVPTYNMLLLLSEANGIIIFLNQL